MTMKTIKRDYRYQADRERRWPIGTGIIVGILGGSGLWVVVYAAVYFLILEK